MTQLVVLKLGKGNWQQGFPTVILQIWKTGSFAPMQLTGSLPPAPELSKLYQQWRTLYAALSNRLSWRGRSFEQVIEFEEDEIAQVSDVEFRDLCEQLKSQLNLWLDSALFGKIERRLRTKLNPAEEIRIVIETEDEQLRRLPWHLWNFFEDYHQAEVALSTQDYEPLSLRESTGKVRILAILGNSQGIKIQQDRALLEQLPNAQTVFLVEPQRSELDRWLWDEQGWDILFFAGHSSSQSNGTTSQIEINRRDALTISQLRNALKAAISRGLKLAIFNSCDGLGLARELADLHIPQIIVMRESVPDLVAQEFLKHLLPALSDGKSFYLAVREAREKLQGLEDEYPCASWLPVICQNPAAVSPRWTKWQKATQRDRRQLWHQLRQVALTSLMVTGLVMGVRWLGFLQSQELRVFDFLMRLRPDEKVDPRLLIVTINQDDIHYQDKQGMKRQGSLADRALLQLLKKLKPYQPEIIGLDIYRDPPVLDSESAALANRWRGDRFIDICQVGEEVSHSPEILPPPGISLEQVGFSDLPKDPDLVIRRQIFGMSPGKPDQCYSDKSFSFQMAHHYLTGKKIKFNRLANNRFQIGTRIFQRVELHSGGYHNFEAGGFEVMLNYRTGEAIAPQVPLQEILDGSRDSELPNLVRGRIVLIGTLDRSYGDDYHLTPYSGASEPMPEMPGVEIQGQMVSQILSAVLDKRPILWWLPQWGDAAWVWGWSFVGGLIVWGFHSRLLYLILVGITAIATLSGLCFIVLWLTGGWLPLSPSLLALVVSGGVWGMWEIGKK